MESAGSGAVTPAELVPVPGRAGQVLYTAPWVKQEVGEGGK